MKRWIKVALGVAVVVVAAAVGLPLLFGAGDRTPEVRTEEVATRELVSVITATGNVRPRRQVNISSDVMGRVVEVNVEEGDEVERGMLLLRIDPSAIEAQVSRARAGLSQAPAQVTQSRANLIQAERDLARVEGIRATDPNLVSRQALDDAETQVEILRSVLQSSEFGVEQARAQLAEVEDQRSRTTIRAPISGRVTRLNIEEGETAVVGTMNNPGSLLLTVGDLSVIEAVLTVDETDVPRIALGDSAVVEMDAFPGQEFAGVVARIGNSAIQATGNQARASVDFEVVLTLLDPPEALRPDLSATAEIIVDRRDDALAVPIISVALRPSEDGDEDDEGVFVVEGDRAVWTPVTLGITGATHFEVLSGLSAGDVVVSGPFQSIQTLQDGDAVRPMGASGAAAASRD